MVGQRIAQLRRERGMKQPELASMLNISRSTLSMWETGERSPGLDDLCKLADIFEVSTDYLLGRTDDPRLTTAPVLVINPSPPPEAKDVVIPVLSTIRPGLPVYSSEHIEGWERFPRDRVAGGEHFCLRVPGDSMSPTIPPGSIILIRAQSAVDDGAIAAILVSDEPIIRRLYRAGDMLILKPDNPAYAPQVTKTSEARVLGKVVEVRYRIEEGGMNHEESAESHPVRGLRLDTARSDSPFGQQDTIGCP